MNPYQYTKESLIENGEDVSEAEGLGEEISKASDMERLKALVSALNLVADALSWPQDHDFGALVLQKASRSVRVKEFAAYVLEEAIRRAHYCTQCGSSGGECLQRAEHWEQLKKELKELKIKPPAMV